MAVSLRLRRMGRRKRPLYALVAADSRSPRDGRYIEDLGRYEPVQEPAVVKLNEERILDWLQKGAQPSPTVRNLLSRQGIMLHPHLIRKGKTEEEIAQALEQHRNRSTQATPTKTTKKVRAAEALKAERERVAKQEAEDAKRRAAEEAERQRLDEEARRAAAEARAAEAARQQEEANAAQTERDRAVGEAARAQEAANVRQKAEDTTVTEPVEAAIAEAGGLTTADDAATETETVQGQGATVATDEVAQPED
ncbi:MAG TPA: 30S ribosomal protein S16, partial [Rhodothermales bacterium]|nr:30S ribosomal protein S16 [Rhodothermales bacterium]